MHLFIRIHISFFIYMVQNLTNLTGERIESVGYNSAHAGYYEGLSALLKQRIF